MKKYIIAIFLFFLLIFTIIPQAKILQKKVSNVEINENNTLKFQDVEYSTFIGGFGFEWAMAIATDSQGSAYVTGITRSILFPTKNPYDGSYNFLGDVFVTKLAPSGKTLDFSTFIGGSNSEHGIMITVDDEGYIYVCGCTSSKNFPLKNSIQNSNNGKSDVFIVKLSPSGKDIIYSTLVGGSGIDLARDFDLDKNGSIYVTGRTTSKDFPMKNAYDETHNGTWDAFVFKISPEGDKINFSTFIGGKEDEWGYGIAVDKSECIYVSGNTTSPDFPLKNAFDTTMEVEEAYITKINPSGNSLNYSTFLGGSKGEKGWGLTIDGQNCAYICGRTNSTDFPVQNPVQKTKNYGWDMYVSKISKNGDDLVYSTYLGGNGIIEEANRITVDQQGCAYITGFTTSSDFPVMNPFDGTYNGKWDSFVTKLSSDGDKLEYSTYLGGRKDDNGYQVAVDKEGGFYVTGWTESPDFPTKNAFDKKYGGFRDSFVTKFSPSGYNPIKTVKGGLFLNVGINSNKSKLNWSINVTGNILTGGLSNGTIPAYSYEVVRLGLTIGFGKVNIKIMLNDLEKHYSAIMLGPFFLRVRKV
ncbi:MAG: SBBP repeat-containing protein [Thermoplasmatales archaeon]|nr:SBBP repeat-containing protein [Thermoplasmatales archaeon]